MLLLELALLGIADATRVELAAVAEVPAFQHGGALAEFSLGQGLARLRLPAAALITPS